MAVHKKDDILGYDTGRGIFCSECLPEGAKIQVLLTEETKDDDTIYICDRCKEQL
jgi:hypothetical protein